MIQREITLDWRVGEEDFTQHAKTGRMPFINREVVSIGLGERRLTVVVLRWLSCLTLAFLVVSASSVDPVHQRQIRLNNELYGWLAVEEQSWLADDQDRYLALIDPEVDSHWRRDWLGFWTLDPAERDSLKTTLNSISFAGPYVQMQVTVERPSVEWWRSSPYREYRYFEWDDTGWKRTIPSDSFWGESQALESAHIALEFSHRDTHLATQIWPKLEALYLTLHERLQLAPKPGAPKHTFVLIHEPPRGWTRATYRQFITAPGLSKIPLALSDEDYIMQQIVSRLTYQTVDSMLDSTNSSFISQWETLIWALNGWLRTDLLNQRTPWHMQAEDLLRAAPKQEEQLSLSAIGPWRSRGGSDQAAIMRRYIEAESVIAYIVSAHGRAILPELIRGLSEHSTWDTLVPAIFATDVDQFEDNWHEYLADRFKWSRAE